MFYLAWLSSNKMSQVIVTKAKATQDLKSDIQKLLKPLEGIEKFIKPGDKVLLKPNLNTDDPFPGSSSSDFLEAVIEIVKTARPARVILGDSCTMSMKTEEVMKTLGIFEMAKRLGIEVLNFEKAKFIRKKIAGKYLKSIRVPAVLDEIDRLILLPCLKTHRFARFTMSLKLGVGFMKKIDRMLLHATHFEEKVAEINLAYKPDLIILDGRKAFVSHGPDRGELVEPNILIAGTDCVAVDIEGLKILKSYPADNKLTGDIWQLPQIKRAVELGLGVRSESQYNLVKIP